MTAMMIVSAVALYLGAGVLTARALATRVHAWRLRVQRKKWDFADDTEAKAQYWARDDTAANLVLITLAWPPVAVGVLAWPTTRLFLRGLEWVLWWTIGWPVSRLGRFVMTPLGSPPPDPGDVS